LLLLTLLAGGSTNCLLDTGPINMPPTVQVDNLAESLYRGKDVTFTATIHDPDQSTDSLDVTWYVGTDTNCDTAAISALGSCKSQPSNDQCLYTPQVLASVCVVVQVKDQYGASAEARRAFNVQDQPPTAVIERKSPASTDATLPLSSNLVFSASSSTDPDPGDKESLTYAWTVTQPDGTKLSENTVLCSFIAASPGTYHVQLIVTDSSMVDSAPAAVDVVIDQDQPPCIVGFAPQDPNTILFPEQSNSFVVTSVADDVDPYPGSTSGTFTWSWRRGTSGDFTRVSNPQPPNRLDFGPDLFVTGDVIQVRVKYQDRISRNFSTCDQNADRCELKAGSGCAQWVTWTGSFL
jgi:hypothetical protein